MSDRMSRRWLCVAGLALIGALAPAPAEPPAAVLALAKEQLSLVDQAEKYLQRLAELGELKASDHLSELWSKRKVEAVRTSGAQKSEVIRALEHHVEVLKKAEVIIKELFEKGEGTKLDTYDARYRRLEGELWLLEEKAR
jgi:hypothetical protein